MFANLFVSPPVSQRHTGALESTARATTLHKWYHSGRHTRCVSDSAELQLPFCELRYMKTDTYLRTGVRKDHTQTLELLLVCLLITQNTATCCTSPTTLFFHAVSCLREAQKSQENPHTRQHRLPIFHHPPIKSWSRISALASLQICSHDYSGECRRASRILYHTFRQKPVSSTHTAFPPLYLELEQTICYSNISKAKLFETEQQAWP